MDAAMILAIGISIPKNVVLQDEFASFYLKLSNCQDEDTSNVYQKICKESGIQKRRFCTSSEELRTIASSSLNTRQDLALREVPVLGKEAAENAISSWGGEKSSITHLIFSTSSGVFAPGFDIHLQKMLCLSDNVHRTMLIQQHGHGGVAALRMAKDIAENNKGSRVLVVCSEMMAYSLHPITSSRGDFLSSATFGDGAAAVVMGANPSGQEKSLFEIHSSSEIILPGGDHAIKASLTEHGMVYQSHDYVACSLSENLSMVLRELFVNRSIPSYNDLFWAVHPCNTQVLEELEAVIGSNKLETSKEVLASHGDMLSASILFVLRALCDSSTLLQANTSSNWGIAIGYGPGITIDALLLKKST